MNTHRTRTNRPAYFDEYRAAFDQVKTCDGCRREYYPDGLKGGLCRWCRETPDETAERYLATSRNDWRDGTDEGWGE